MKATPQLENISKLSWVLIGLNLIALVGITDVLTGYELSLSLLYLLPISLVVWYAGKNPGIAASVVSAFVWLAADILSGRQYSQPLIFVWNAAIRFGFFLIVTLLLAGVKALLEREQFSSRTDHLTGAASSGYFQILLRSEMDRSTRYGHPFTLAYLDLDDFKGINDKFGHTTGDQVLQVVVDQLKRQLRKTDVVARLGGDEFAILLPETDERMAPIVIARTQHGLSDTMAKSNWSVTFSIGVMTFPASPDTPNDAIRLVDELMYDVKRHGKNAVSYSAYNA